MILGIDAHKRSHTIVAVGELGRKLGERCITAISSDHLELLEWAERFGRTRLWAVEDCRHLSRRLERDLLGAGETIVRVPPKLMAHSRDAARTFGKSLVTRCREITARGNDLETEIQLLIAPLSPALLAVHGCGVLSAAKIIRETAGVQRFHSKDAFAKHNGTAPLPVWSANCVRHRLSRMGNRQINAALHRIALTQARHNPQAREYLARRRAAGSSTTEAMRCLKRRLSDVVYRALVADHESQGSAPLSLVA